MQLWYHPDTRTSTSIRMGGEKGQPTPQKPHENREQARHAVGRRYRDRNWNLTWWASSFAKPLWSKPAVYRRGSSHTCHLNQATLGALFFCVSVPTLTFLSRKRWSAPGNEAGKGGLDLLLLPALGGAVNVVAPSELCKPLLAEAALLSVCNKN